MCIRKINNFVLSITARTNANIKSLLIVKPESKSPIPCPNRPQILTLRSDQV